jgi:hypothetical protein
MDFLWKKQISPPDDSNPPEAYHGLAACLNEPSHSLLYHRHIWAACSPHEQSSKPQPCPSHHQTHRQSIQRRTSKANSSAMQKKSL